MFVETIELPNLATTNASILLNKNVSGNVMNEQLIK